MAFVCFCVCGFEMLRYVILLRVICRYITEIAPSARRGMLVSMPQFMACAGICAGYL